MECGAVLGAEQAPAADALQPTLLTSLRLPGAAEA